MGRASRRRAERRATAAGLSGVAAAPSEPAIADDDPWLDDDWLSPAQSQQVRSGLGGLSELAAERARLERAVDQQVQLLAGRGYSWAAIGRALGMSRQGARQRYGRTHQH